ncbi:MAG: aminoacyl-tRNA hydrolase [Bacteroidales bacterium]|nr:aminoacyl-tRNA hydrolase [Bacteroidales bacterium]
MPLPPVTERNFYPEFRFQTSRSSGPGGQHVNKTESRVELFFNIDASTQLDDEEKERLQRKLKKRINADGELIIASEITRSQIRNKEDCIKKFFELIEKVLTIEKKRIATRPSLAARKKRLETKRLQSEKKQLRKKP